MSAADEYRRRVETVEAQRGRLTQPEGTGRWNRLASFFRMDPRRALDPNLEILASLIEPEDVVIDVGGGAGRLSLPLALRCREVLNIEPAAEMGRLFDESKAEAGITNASWRESEWPTADGVTGDVALVANVTYFVEEIEPFVRALESAARRLVIVSVWSVPPPDATSTPFELVTGEAQERVPGHRELLEVLWEMGILPDVRVLPLPFIDRRPLPATRAEAVSTLVETLQVADEATAKAKVEANFGALFRETEKGFAPTWRPHAQEMLISWRPGSR